ncbi:MAG: HD domain-containing protein, partial [Thermoguttaceae bacterium]|nr:HD domain-containing protein [Thermoguttaceae bacterium]
MDIVGQSFGVLKVGANVDVALPRRESKNGLGHKGFNVESASTLTPREAFARRDFTINAIGMRRDGSFCDPFDGIGDLKRKMLRATSPAFKDDPLRVLRGMQFSARFGFSTDSKTLQYCREVLPEYSTLSEERVYEEWKKWAIKGEYPEIGLTFLRDSGWIDAFPELAALIDCPQNPDWHPEGDVWTHTLAVCNQAAKIVRAFKPELTNEEKLYVMFAALAHDFGKPATTRLDENGVIRSMKHDKVGAPIARAFFEKMKAPTRVLQAIEKLVREHMTDIDAPSVRAIQRLANRLSPANIKLWALLRQADAMGCGAPERHLSEGIDLSALSGEPIAKKIKV